MISSLSNQTTTAWTEIKENINRWNTIKYIPTLSIPLFEGNTLFKFMSPAVGPVAKLHFYPAVETVGSVNKLLMYIIRTEDDKLEVYEEYEREGKDYTNLITKSEVIQAEDDNVDDLTSRISPLEAVERIGNWLAHHNRWLEDGGSSDGIFDAFSLDSDYINLHGPIDGFFGLVGKPKPFDFKADLILLNPTNEGFYNTVRPVPPYPPEEPSDFFLLEASMNP